MRLGYPRRSTSGKGRTFDHQILALARVEYLSLTSLSMWRTRISAASRCSSNSRAVHCSTVGKQSLTTL